MYSDKESIPSKQFGFEVQKTNVMHKEKRYYYEQYILFGFFV